LINGVNGFGSNSRLGLTGGTGGIRKRFTTIGFGCALPHAGGVEITLPFMVCMTGVFASGIVNAPGGVMIRAAMHSVLLTTVTV
jgi:hypothetical protein